MTYRELRNLLNTSSESQLEDQVIARIDNDLGHDHYAITGWDLEGGKEPEERRIILHVGGILL